MEVKLIVAAGEDMAIGRAGGLIWKIPDDLRRFKTLTLGHPVIMGRKTWESLPKKPLPGRKNIVLSHNENYEAAGAEVAGNMNEALQLCEGETPYIIGGAGVYKAFMPKVTEIFLTRVFDKCEDADTFLDIDLSWGWQLIEESPVMTTPDGVAYQYLTYRKKCG